MKVIDRLKQEYRRYWQLDRYKSLLEKKYCQDRYEAMETLALDCKLVNRVEIERMKKQVEIESKY